MTVTLTFVGAADTVTGSRTLLTYRGKTWLVDCGLFQGPKPVKERNWTRFEPDPSTLAGVVLTHAHLDHSGYLPRLCREGFKGPIIASAGTADLCRILLRDAAKLEQEFADYANERGYSHHKPALPLFTDEDVDLALKRFRVEKRREWVELMPGMSLRFRRAGHIIGSCLVELAFDTPAGQRLLVFSGDLGNGRSHILRPPEPLIGCDALVIEGTYGDRLQPRWSALDALADVVARTAARRGVVVIPVFAVGRAQELTYMLRLLEDRGRIPKVPVILDSPMAEQAMEVCLKHTDDQVLDSAFHGDDNPMKPALFEVCQSADESMLACMREGPMIVLSASGMLSGGRILHHLKHRLPDARNTVIFAGHQAEGTKGRYLQEHGAHTGLVKIHHEEVQVEAEILTLDHFSSHADRQDVLDYLDRMRVLPKTVIVNHGSPAAQGALADAIRMQFGVEALRAIDAGSVKLW